MARISKKIVTKEKEESVPEKRPTAKKTRKSSGEQLASADNPGEKPAANNSAVQSSIVGQTIAGDCLASVKKLFDSKDQDRKNQLPVIEQILREIGLRSKSNSIVRGVAVALLMGDFSEQISVAGDTGFARHSGGRGRSSNNGVTAACERVAALSQSSADTVADDYSRVRKLLVEPLKKRIDNKCAKREIDDFFETRIELLLEAKPELLKTAIAHDSSEKAMEILEPKIIGSDRTLNFRNADFKQLLFNDGARNANFEAAKVKKSSVSQEPSPVENPAVQSEPDTAAEPEDGRTFEILSLLTEAEFKKLNRIAEVKSLSHDEAIGLLIINFNL